MHELPPLHEQITTARMRALKRRRDRRDTILILWAMIALGFCLGYAISAVGLL